MKSLYDTRFAQAFLQCNMEDEWEINEIFVDPRFRGRGHGTELLEQICRDADLQGVTLTLEVCCLDQSHGMRDPELLEWYKRHGFRRYGANLTNFVMMAREPLGASLAA